MADAISGKGYIKIVEMTDSGSDIGARATIELYRKWSEAGRADSSILVHEQAVEYDP